MSAAHLNVLREGAVIPEVVPEQAALTIKGALRVHYPEFTVFDGAALPRPATLKQPDLEFPEAVSMPPFESACSRNRELP